jgi:hypothetical protein
MARKASRPEATLVEQLLPLHRHCPICGWEVHRDVPGDQRPYTVVAQESEDACHQHLRNHHPVQYRLWLRFGWSWLIRGFV